MLDGLALGKGSTMPMVLSFLPKVLGLSLLVLLFILTVCLLILIVGPVVQTMFFLILLARDLGLAIRTVFFLILLARGRCSFLYRTSQR